MGPDPPRIAVTHQQVDEGCETPADAECPGRSKRLEACGGGSLHRTRTQWRAWPNAAEETSGSDHSALRSTPALSRAADEPREAAGVCAKDRSAWCGLECERTRRREEGWAPFPSKSFVADGPGSNLDDRQRTPKTYTCPKPHSHTAERPTTETLLRELIVREHHPRHEDHSPPPPLHRPPRAPSESFPPMRSRCTGSKRHEGGREIRASTLAASADLGDEPVAVGDAVDVKGPHARSCTNDPLVRARRLNAEPIVIAGVLPGARCV